jgi:hypothetical protein
MDNQNQDKNTGNQQQKSGGNQQQQGGAQRPDPNRQGSERGADTEKQNWNQPGSGQQGGQQGGGGQQSGNR